MQATFHILNGDALAELFPVDLAGQRIIFREMLMEGPICGTLDAAFYNARKEFLLKEYGIDDLDQLTAVTSELEKLKSIPVGSRVYLWFEYDLFCQVNFWACCRWLTQNNCDLQLSWVAPGSNDWRGFGNYSTDGLRGLLDSSTLLLEGHLEEFEHCLAIYSGKSHEELSKFLGRKKLSPASKAVLEAELARLPNASGQIGLIKELIKIKAASQEDFGAAFRIFCKEWGIYGMGDLQFRRLYNSINEK